LGYQKLVKAIQQINKKQSRKDNLNSYSKLQKTFISIQVNIERKKVK